MGSCPRPADSHRAGVRHWTRYIRIVYGDDEAELRAFPPRLNDVLAWSKTLHCLGTFCNYLNYIWVPCHAIDCEATLVDNVAIRGAMIAIKKRELHHPRLKMFIDRHMLCNMVLAVGRDWEHMSGAALWMTSYIFLLRLPPELH